MFSVNPTNSNLKFSGGDSASQSPASARDPPTSVFDRPVPLPPIHCKSFGSLMQRPNELSSASAQPLSPPPSRIMSPSEGSESDDELSLPAGSHSLNMPDDDYSRPASHDSPAPLPSNVPPMANRIRGSQSHRNIDEPSPYVELKS